MGDGLLILSYAVAGVALGTVTGLVPGLHVNSVAFLLVGIAPTLSGPAVAVGAAVISAGIVHTFLSVIPGLVLGVPEAATAAGALPGHRLVLQGYGREAIRLSALGSGISLTAALIGAVPLSWIIASQQELLREILPFLLLGIAGALVIMEPTWRSRGGGIICFCIASGLGFLALDLPAAGILAPDGSASMLGPIFAGLFGAPVLLDALTADGEIPPQTYEQLSLSPLSTVRAALAGTGGGALVGYLPGVSSGVAAVLALGGAGGSGVAGQGADRTYVVATSGADTATAVFAVASLAVLGSPRSGVTVALSELGGGSLPAGLVSMLIITVVAAALGIAILVTIGDLYLDIVRRLPRRPLVLLVLGLLIILSVGFAGLLGGGVFLFSTVIGLVPPRVRARRVHLMAVLLGPVALG
jgi:putative membrane protein